MLAKIIKFFSEEGKEKKATILSRKMLQNVEKSLMIILDL